MFFQKPIYQIYSAAILFFACLVLAIVLHTNQVLIVPFIWLLLPLIIDFCVKRTEQLFWFLIIALPLSSELNLTASLGLDFPDEIFMLLLTGIFFLKVLHQPKWFPKNLLTEPLFLWLLLMMCWTFVSACFANNSMLSLKFFLARIWFIVPFVLLPQLLLNSQTRIRKFALLLLVPMLFVVIQALARQAFYGFNFVDVKKAMNPFFRNHVNYSSMLVCLLVPAIAMWFLTAKENQYRKWIGIAIFIGLIALFFSYSRGAWVALVLGLVYAFIMDKGWVKKILLTVLVLMISLSTWLFVDYHYMRFAPDHDHTIFHTDFSEHIAATVSLKDVSNAERFYRWIAGYRMVLEQPITGFGPNSFYNSYRPYTVKVFETWVSDNPEHSTVHNYFLLTLAEQGIPGLALLLILWLAMLFRLQFLYHHLQSKFYRLVALSVGVVLAMIASIKFMSDMIETDKIGSLFWLSLGFVFILNSKWKEERNSIA